MAYNWENIFPIISDSEEGLCPMVMLAIATFIKNYADFG